uniref:RNA polymerase II-associated factor 1 homolog n=1 Tax=Myxine glutinosa TaxID=7769 RepID=UPI00358FF420
MTILNKLLKERSAQTAMAPTIQTTQRDQENRLTSHRSTGERSVLICRVKYNNTLPDIPFDAKFITYPFGANRFVQYKATSLEKQHMNEMLTETDLSVTIDLIHPDTYKIEQSVCLHPDDEKLLEEEIPTPQGSKRSLQHAKVVPWMRKTEYISTEFNRYGISNEKPEIKIGVSVKQQFTEDDIYKDRESQITAIEKTFEDVKKEIETHYSKPRVHPTEILPVFPDFKMWINPCAQVIFDADPAPKGMTGSSAVDTMSQAMIRGMMDEERNQFVAYFLPNESTMRKRKRDVEEGLPFTHEEEYEYRMAREYNWNVKNKASKGYEENYFFIFREDDGVYYNELETRVRLSKRRARIGQGVQQSNNTLLQVRHRNMNEKELEAQEARKAQLENHEPEDEEEEEEAKRIVESEEEEDEEEKEAEEEKEDDKEKEEEEDHDEKGSEHSESEGAHSESEGEASDSESGEERHVREEEIFGSGDSESDEGGKDSEREQQAGSRSPSGSSSSSSGGDTSPGSAEDGLVESDASSDEN